MIGKKPVFAIEAGVINGWEKFIDEKNFIGMNSFGSSAPYKKLYEYFGLTESNLTKIVQKKIKRRI